MHVQLSESLKVKLKEVTELLLKSEKANTQTEEEYKQYRDYVDGVIKEKDTEMRDRIRVVERELERERVKTKVVVEQEQKER